MNVNPNSPADVPGSALLGTAVMYTANISNNFIGGLYSQQYAQNTYVLEDLYSSTTSEQNGIWNNSYNVVIKNAMLIKKKAIAAEDSAMRGVADVLLAQAFNNLTDIFGDVPFSETMRLDEGITTPKYDKQSDIYKGILDLLKEANDFLDPNAAVSGDILFSGKAIGWKKYANALRLRIALRMSAANKTIAVQVFKDVLGNSLTNPIIDENSENASLKWPGESPYYEPWYNIYRGGNDNYASSKVMIDELVALNDPRLPIYATKASATNTYVGAVNGPLTADIPNRTTVSRIGNYFTQNPSGTTNLLIAAETWFSIAEASETGLDNTFLAKDAYLNGLRASFEQVGIDWNSSIVNTYLAQDDVKYVPGDVTGNLYKIRIQKWICLYLQGIQAWAEERRTDVPLLSPAPGTRYPGLHNRPPFRLQYPSLEQDLNKENFDKARQDANINEEKDLFWGNQMWWDKRVNVY